MTRLGRPLDTSEEAYRVWIEALRRLGPEGRLRKCFELRAALTRRLEEGIRQRHPGYRERELKLARARLVLGEELVRQAYPGETAPEP